MESLQDREDHSLSVADVDGDGCQEIIYGAAVIDHDAVFYIQAMITCQMDVLQSLVTVMTMHVAR